MIGADNEIVSPDGEYAPRIREAMDEGVAIIVQELNYYGVELKFSQGRITIRCDSTHQIEFHNGVGPRENTGDLRPWVRISSRPASGTQALAPGPSAPTQLQI